MLRPRQTAVPFLIQSPGRIQTWGSSNRSLPEATCPTLGASKVEAPVAINNFTGVLTRRSGRVCTYRGPGEAIT